VHPLNSMQEKTAIETFEARRGDEDQNVVVHKRRTVTGSDYFLEKFLFFFPTGIAERQNE
jgi:hypothetical protein